MKSFFGRVVRAVDISGQPERFRKIIFVNYDKWNIKNVFVVRVPLSKALQCTIKAIPGVEIGNSVLYHLEQWFEITSPSDENHVTWVKVSKDQIVNVEQTDVAPRVIFDEENTLKLTIHTTLGEYFRRLIKEATERSWSLWKYNPVSANCQWFVWWCLIANGLEKEVPRSFVVQDEAELVGSTARKAMTTVTDLANVATRFFSDGGFISGDERETASKEGGERGCPCCEAVQNAGSGKSELLRRAFLLRFIADPACEFSDLSLDEVMNFINSAEQYCVQSLNQKQAQRVAKDCEQQAIFEISGKWKNRKFRRLAESFLKNEAVDYDLNDEEKDFVRLLRVLQPKKRHRETESSED